MNINRPQDFERVETARKPGEPPPHRVGTRNRGLLWGSGLIFFAVAMLAWGS